MPGIVSVGRMRHAHGRQSFTDLVRLRKDPDGLSDGQSSIGRFGTPNVRICLAEVLTFAVAYDVIATVVGP